jgi:outer membrane lipoprotein carrier protein
VKRETNKKKGKGAEGEMMKRRSKRALLLFLFLSLSPFYLFPVTLAAVAGRANELELLVKKIEARYGRMRGLAAEFEQTYSAPGARSVRRESGRLFLARPRKMRWEYSSKLFIVNGRDVWFYVPADREAMHADAGSISDERFPFLFLLGQTNLRRAFSSITLSENNNQSAETRTLRLIPRNNAAGLREVSLEVMTDGRITRVRLQEASGAASEISLWNVRENYVAPAESFEFRPPAGVRIREQR